MKTIQGFNVGDSFQVLYPVGGNRNILRERRYGTVVNLGTSAKGGYATVKYTCHKTGRPRLATFSTAKMINPALLSK